MTNPNSSTYGMDVVLEKVREEIERVKEHLSRGAHPSGDSALEFYYGAVGTVRGLRAVESFILDTYKTLDLE